MFLNFIVGHPLSESKMRLLPCPCCNLIPEGHIFPRTDHLTATLRKTLHEIEEEMWTLDLLTAPDPEQIDFLLGDPRMYSPKNEIAIKTCMKSPSLKKFLLIPRHRKTKIGMYNTSLKEPSTPAVPKAEATIDLSIEATYENQLKS